MPDHLLPQIPLRRWDTRKKAGLAGNRTQDLSHAKGKLYH